MFPLLLAVSLSATPPSAPPPAPPPTSDAHLAERISPDRPWRVRVGVLAGAISQNTELELGIAWDFLKPHPLVRLVVDFGVGIRPSEVSLLPMAGARFLLPLKVNKLEVWLAGLVGGNISFRPGQTYFSVPFRFGAGATWSLKDNFALGIELSVDVGPLLAPRVATYAAGRVAAVAAWSF